MNDGSTILNLQKSSKAVALLAAQRQLYADAKLLYSLYGVLVTLPPFFVLAAPDDSALILIASVVLPIVLGRILTSLADNKQREAASVQQKFDSYVFGLSLRNTNHNESLAARRYRHYAKKKGVSDLPRWYPQRISGLPSGKAESECQKVNILWTKDLAVMALLIDIFVATVIIFVAVQGIRRSGADSIECVILTPIIEWVVECALDRWHLYLVAREIEQSVRNLGSDEEKQIVRTQSLIYELRCLRPVPDFLYFATKNYEQSKADYKL